MFFKKQFFSNYFNTMKRSVLSGVLVLVCSVLIVLVNNSCITFQKISDKQIQKIIESQDLQIPDSTRQLLMVFSDEENEVGQATLVVLSRVKYDWDLAMKPIPAGIGKNGFAAPGEKVEGDGKTPSGIFKLGQLFTYENAVDTKMPFSQSTVDDKWIDDPESPDYNRHIKGETDAGSYENLKLQSNHYKYCMVIEYNTNPLVKGKGSAIFFHLRETENETTAGCVAISETEMLQILKWLDPKEQPMILMGTLEGVPDT